MSYHESISNLTPADVYFGRGQTILIERERIKRQTIANRRLLRRPQAHNITNQTSQRFPFYFLSCIGDDHALRTDAYFFPMRFHDDKGGLFGKSEVTNLSSQAKLYLNGLGCTNIDDDPAKRGIYVGSGQRRRRR
jgi:hypothetical protein